MMQTAAEQPSTRMLFFGERALAEGFALIGFEIWPDAQLTQLDAVLREVQASRRSAFVIIDQQLADAGSRVLPELYGEGGRIVIAVVPSLAEPESFQLDIDAQVRTLLGGQPLEETG